MSELAGFTTESLEAELKRRKELHLLNQIPQSFAKSPIGKWQVTTEGDVEGKTVTDLGVWDGHIVDIARSLSGHCCYSLTFKPAKTPVTLPCRKIQPQASIVLDISSNTWGLDPIRRRDVVDSFLAIEKAKSQYILKYNTYYGSTLLVFGETK